MNCNMHNVIFLYRFTELKVTFDELLVLWNILCPRIRDRALGTRILHIILILLFYIVKKFEICDSSQSKVKDRRDKIMKVAKKSSEDWMMKWFHYCFGESQDYKEEVKVHNTLLH